MKWITESMKRSRKLKDQYSMRGTEIYINEQPPENIDLEFVFEYIAARVPKRLLDSVDVIYVGKFPEFEEREINAFYDMERSFITNEQDDEQDMIDDHSTRLPMQLRKGIMILFILTLRLNESLWQSAKPSSTYFSL